MKTFRTVLPAWPAPFSLTHADGLLLIGSCFTEHIGTRLTAGKFPVFINPNGIVYNPVSIARGLEALLMWERPETSGSIRSLFERIGNSLHNRNGLWHSWEHHGDFSKPDREAAAAAMVQRQAEAARFLEKTTCLMLTLGTAEVFFLKESGQVVANCHKAPATLFEQRRLSVGETADALEAVLVKLHERYPAINVLLTVSPVRHLRNGLVENQRSKAVLLLACAELCARHGFVHYFPGYELLLDDLRDYRFYAADMTHPSELAIDYIWQYFADAFFPEATKRLLEQLEKIAAAMRHRPFHPDSAEHRAFARGQMEKIEMFREKYPELDFVAELDYFRKMVSGV